MDTMAPTTGISLNAAISFLGYVFGADGAIDATSSPRVKGMAAEILKRKRARFQAPPLTAEALIALENATLKSRSRADRI
eukprot:6213123-Amphidinium_carterae.1